MSSHSGSRRHRSSRSHPPRSSKRHELEPAAAPSPSENGFSRLLRNLIEGLSLLLLVASPWAFGSAEPQFEAWLLLGVAALLVLWGLRMVVQGRAWWARSGVAICLSAIFVVGVIQLLPLPHSVLSRISPSTTALIDELMPSKPEKLPFGLSADPRIPPPGQTLSLYPSATRLSLLRLLAVLAVFSVIRNNCVSAGAFKRFAIVCFMNGAALCLFALVQFFSSSHRLLYWTFEAPAEVFGPFICRNHFPFYVNVGVGLGLGVLFWCISPKDSSSESGRGSRSTQPETYYDMQTGSFSPGDILQIIMRWVNSILSNPVALCIGATLALMFCTIFVSLSRGGILALALALVLCTCLKILSRGQALRSAAALLIVPVAFALLSWVGWDMVQARIDTLWEAQALESRIPLWTDSLPLLREYPLFGTGYGTFQYVYPLHKTEGSNKLNFIYDHAHNDYLEAGVEGGLARLLPALLAIWLVYRAGFRALRATNQKRDGELIYGALLGFTTIVVHSAGEFGLHIPAITYLVAMLAAQLEGSPEWATEKQGQPLLAQVHELRVLGIAPLAALCLCVLLGGLFFLEGRRVAMQAMLRRRAEVVKNQVPGSGDRQITLLYRAVDWTPDSAYAQQELGEAYLMTYLEKLEALDAYGVSLNDGGAFFSCPITAQLGGLAARISAATATVTTSLAWSRTASKLYPELEEKYRGPALLYTLQARNLCPLLPKAQSRLATLQDKLVAGDSRKQYLERAKRLASDDAELWYLAGSQALADAGENMNATALTDVQNNWHKSLQLSSKFMPEILTQSFLLFPPKEILDHVLPDDPVLIVKATDSLRAPAEVEDRRQFFVKAAEILSHTPESLNARDLWFRGRVFLLAGMKSQALDAYRTAVSRDPTLPELRLELVETLIDEEKWGQAREELKEAMNSRANPARVEALALRILAHENPK